MTEMLDFGAIFANARKRADQTIKKQGKQIEEMANKSLDEAKTKHNETTTPTLENAIERVAKKYHNKATIDFVTATFQRGIGQRLREIREQNDYTLDDIVIELSDFWEVDKSTINRWENAKREISVVYIVWFAQRFDVDLHWLMTGEKKSSSTISTELRKKLEEVLEISKKL